MRTNIADDDKPLRDTLEATGLGLNVESVDRSRRATLKLRDQAEIRSLGGKITWSGDLDASRVTRATQPGNYAPKDD